MRRYDTQDKALLALVPDGEANAITAKEIAAKGDWLDPRSCGTKLSGLHARMTDPYTPINTNGVKLHHKPKPNSKSPRAPRVWWRSL